MFKKLLNKTSRTAVQMAIEALRQQNTSDESTDSFDPEQEQQNCILTIWGDCSYNETGCSDCLIKEKITKALSAQPERKKGEWKKYGRWGRTYVCNQCGNFLDFTGVNTGRGDANFCPNCGADMRPTQNLKYADSDTAYCGLRSAT